MLKRSRVGTSPDVARIGQALARPGIDTRTWISLAQALGEPVVDPDEGVFVDVLLLPTGERYTARLCSEYAGNGFGLYAPVHKDDMVVVEITSGDPSEEVVISKRLWNGADPPPTDIANNPNDVLLLIEKDKNVRIKVQGQGNINLIVDGGVINLVAESPSDAMALAQKTLNELTNLANNVNANYTKLGVTLGQVALLLNTPGPVIGAPATVTPYVETAAVAPQSVASEKVKAQ